MPGVNIGYGYRGGNYHWSAWNVVPGRYFTQRNIWNHCLPYSQVNTFINNTTIINNTTVINNNTYFTGPAMTDVERYSGKVIPLSLRNLNKVTVSTVDDNSVSMYRPDVTENTGKAQNRAFRPANVTPANQATTGKANVLLNETPENADNLASPKGNSYNPNIQTRDANNPFITPAPSGKSVPSGLGGESGNGGKVTPMPTPIDDERRNTVNPNDGVPKANPTKQVEQPQPRDKNTTKSNPFGSPQATPQQQEEQRQEQRQQEPTRYQKQTQDQQQRDEQQRQEQQRQEQLRQEQQRQQEQQRYQKQTEEQQKRQREEQQRQEQLRQEQQRQQEQQRYQKQAEEQQKRQQEQQQRQEQQKQEQQRYQKQAEEQQRHKEEQQKKSNDAEVKKTPAPQQQNYQKKKGED